MDQPSCASAVDACGATPGPHGMCKRHYARWRRHGHLQPTRLSGKPEDHYEVGHPHDCWVWTGSFNSHGYGRYGRRMAHRVVYEMRRGPVRKDLHLDHLCRNTACVNPNHLEPVKPSVNIARGLNGYALRTLCRQGLHDVSEPSAWYVNTYGTRTCLECKRANDRRAEAKRGPRARSRSHG